MNKYLLLILSKVNIPNTIIYDILNKGDIKWHI